MPECELPRLMVAAPASGSGKTTVTCALLRALVRRGYRTASFKCGPDYIDPMFHHEVVGTDDSANLDLFLSGGPTVRGQLARRADRADIALIEGVMGYYDGIALSTDASSHALARETGTPAVLAVNCRGMAASIAAQVKGFTVYREDSGISAVLLNNLPPGLYTGVKTLIERECGLPVAGYLPPMPECALESRHLGLVTGPEARNLLEKLNLLAEQAEKTVDFDLLLRLAAAAPPLAFETSGPPRVDGRPKIAVARDSAFQFYYADSLALLRELGAELLEFSPLTDAAPPEGADGLWLGGGYPELHARALSENLPMRRAIREVITGGMPTVAECGGFLYLHRTLEDADGTPYPMAGVIDADGKRGERLGRFGYVTLTAKQENLLCGAGETLAGHEFHYWQSTGAGDDFTAQKPQRDTRWPCVHAAPTLYAGFPHLSFVGNPDAAARFLRAAIRYRREKNA